MENGAIMAMGDDSDESTDDEPDSDGDNNHNQKLNNKKSLKMLYMVENKHP